MSHKVTIIKVRVRGKKFWQVGWHDNKGRRRRQFIAGKVAAEALAAQKRGEALNIDRKLIAVSSDDRERMLFVWNEAKRRGIDLLALLNSAVDAPVQSPALADVLSEMETVKLKAGRDLGYLASLRQIVDMFAKGRERLPINKITYREVEAFLDSKNIESRSTLRSRLSTLFKFAVRRGYRPDNPCDRLESQTPPHALPAILTHDETTKCLGWLKQNPRSLAWFALSTFAGLRPEEAEKTTWKEINFDESWIRVEAQTTKVRQRRVVYPLPMAMTWLERAKKLKSKLPLTIKTRKADRNAMRTLLGWKEWKQDCTRHTCASMWLAHTGSAEKVATALGHSENILRKHYMALVTKADAEKFWNLSPNNLPK